MSDRPIRRFIPLAALVPLVTLLLISCLADPSEPIYRPGYLALAPSYESSAAGIVDVAQIRVVLTRLSDGTVEIDEVIDFESESDSESDIVDLTFTVDISTPGEEFSLLLRCISPAGDTVFAAGPDTLAATAASDSEGIVADSIPLDYVGLGSDAMGVTVLTTGITVAFGETITVTAVAFDSSEAVIEGTPIKWISIDTTMAFFPDPGVGQLVGGRVRGTVEIEAHLLTGQTDNVDALVEPVPSSINPASGNNQTGIVDMALASPIVAQVNALDGPMEGVTVLFATPDGYVADASVLTDASGMASTTWTLGSQEGTHAATASVQGVAGLDVDFTATAVATVEPRLSFTNQPSDADEGAVITPVIAVTAYDDFGAVDTDFTGDVAIGIGTNPGDGQLSGTRPVAAVAGVATFRDLSIDAAGTGYTLEATATGYLAATSTTFDIIGAAVPQQVGWINPDGGNWSDGANWNTGSPPSPIDTAVIVYSGDYNVTLDRDATVAALTLGDGGVMTQTLIVDGYNLTTNGILHVVSSGNLTLIGDIAGAGGLVVDGEMQWVSGTVATTGSLAVNDGGGLTFTTTAVKTLETDLWNEGQVVWSGGDIALLSGNIENRPTGTFLAVGEGQMTSTGSFSNRGLFDKDSPDVTTIGVPFHNIDNSVVNIGVGWLVMTSDFEFPMAAHLEGVGTLDITNATILQFEGWVLPGDPGTSTGILTIEGNLTLGSSATIDIDINGTTQSADYDALSVEGTLEVDGVLNINTPTYTPTLSDNPFQVLTFTSYSGNFANIIGTDVGGGVVLGPSWSTGGLDLVPQAATPAEILFFGDSAYGLSTGVFTVSPDGVNLTILAPETSRGYEASNPRWSPDRSQVAYTFGGFGTPNILYVMSSDGLQSQMLVDDTTTYVPRWSPNGTHLAFECGNGTDIVDVCVAPDVTAFPTIPQNTYVVLTDFDTADWETGPWVFAWDPQNNDRIAVVRDSMPPFGGLGQSMIYTMLYDGTSVQALNASGLVLDAGNGPLHIDGNLDFSPDGNWLVFSAADPTGNYSIYRMYRDGTNLQLLTGTVDQDASPAYSPDGTEILFGRDVSPGCNYDLWRMNADGSNPVQVTAEGIICDYNRELLGADWSPDGQQIVVTGFETPGQGGNLFIYVVSRTTTYMTYLTDRAVVGPLRGTGAAAFEIVDFQPNWRP